MIKISSCCVLFMVFACKPVHDDAGKWKILTTKNLIPERSECSMVACNNKIYLVGGGEGNNLPVQMLDPKANEWVEKNAAPSMLHHFQAVSVHNKIYIAEAFITGNYPDQLPAENVFIYDPFKNTWSKGAGLPENRRRAAAGAAVYKGKIYLVAGIQHGHRSGTTNMFDEYDPVTDTWKQLPDAPHIRDHSMAAVIGDKLYAVGGRNTSLHDADNFMSFFDKVVLEADCYDFKTGTWSTLTAKLPKGSGGGALVNYHNKLYYMGGERATATEANAPRADVFVYDPAQPEHWMTIASLNAPRNGTGATVCNDKIYLAGGSQFSAKPVLPPGGGNGNKQPPPPPPANDKSNLSKSIVEVYEE